MTTLLTGFELAPSGTAIPTTTGNGGDAFSAGSNGTGTTFASDNSIPASIAAGTLAAKITIPATAAVVWRGWVLGGPQSFRLYLYLPAYPSANWDVVQSLHTTGGNATIGRLRISATGQLNHVLNATAGTATTGVIPINTLVRLEGTWDTVGGTFTAEAYLGHSTTPIANTSISLSAVAFANTIEQLRFGFPVAGLANAVVYTDAWAVSDTGRLGPVATTPVSGQSGPAAAQTLPLTASSGVGTKSTTPTPTSGSYTFATDQQIASLSTTSAAALRAKSVADGVKSGAYVGGGTAADIDVKSVDTKAGSVALTTALWWRRTGDASYLAPLKAFILASPKPPADVQALNEFRGLFGLFAAVKVLTDAGAWTSADDASVCVNHNGDTWSQFLLGGGSQALPYYTRQVNISGGRWSRLVAPTGAAANEGTMDDSASNWGCVARATHLMWSVLTKNQAQIDHAIDRYKKYLGDQTTGYADYKSSGSYIVSWDNWATGTASGTSQPLKAGIGKTDAANPGLDGVVLNDIDRGNTGYASGSAFYGATGAGLTYPLEAAEFTWAEAAVLINAGHPVRTWGEGGNAFDRMNDRFARHRIAGEQSNFDYAQGDANVYKGARYYASQLSRKNYELNLGVATAAGTAGPSRSMPHGDWIAPADGSSTWGIAASGSTFSGGSSGTTTLTVTADTAVGTAVMPRVMSGTGAAQVLSFTVPAGAGSSVMPLTGVGAGTAQTLGLTGAASPGLSARFGAGTQNGLVLACGNATVTTLPAYAGGGELSTTPLVPDEADGYAQTWVLSTPTVTRRHRAEGSLLVEQTHGLSVWQLDGEWRTGLNPAEVPGATRFYVGGHIYPLDGAERDELIAAGFDVTLYRENT